MAKKAAAATKAATVSELRDKSAEELMALASSLRKQINDNAVSLGSIKPHEKRATRRQLARVLTLASTK